MVSILEALKQRLEIKYACRGAEFEILDPPEVLYMHINDAYENCLALIEGLKRKPRQFSLINLQHLRSEKFKAQANWSEIIQTSDISELESFVDRGYQRVIRGNEDFERECSTAVTKSGIGGAR